MNRKETARRLAQSFGPLRAALAVRDCVCGALSIVAGFVARQFKSCLNAIGSGLSSLVSGFNEPAYSRIGAVRPRQHSEPVPYEKDLLKRAITYWGGLLLGALLYAFVYYVLVKHHTYTSILVASLLLLAYLIVLENSHSIRSILMLCVPIMLTNRGRALVFCGMLSIMLAGPVKNAQANVAELQASMSCCKQYLIIKSDRVVEENVIDNVIKVEKLIYRLVENVKLFAEQLKQKFIYIIELAVTVNRFIELCIEKMKEILMICQQENNQKSSCYSNLEFAYQDCYKKLGKTLGFVCELVAPLKQLCFSRKIVCAIPRSIYRYLDQTIGERLRLYIQIIKNEFYVDIDVKHRYSYTGTKSKNYTVVLNEITHDLELKFWYIRFIVRVFNLVSLIVVIWILITATLYHMHYLTEIQYDNMYIDGYLSDIDRHRKAKALADSSDALDPSDRTALIAADDLEVDEQVQVPRREQFLFPITRAQENNYLQPFSLRMNEVEKSKLLIAGLIWLAIVGYIFFFVFLDFSLYKLVDTVTRLLNDILFSDELPLVAVSTRLGDDPVVKYNRTYISGLRNKTKTFMAQRLNAKGLGTDLHNGSLSSMYRRLMTSIEENIPDDVAILDSLQGCLPKPRVPDYSSYELLGYLALTTFIAVVVEAYAMRSRHCFANLYYPKRARKRAAWLYQKLLTDKAKYDQSDLLARKEDKRSDKRTPSGLRTDKTKRIA